MELRRFLLPFGPIEGHSHLGGDRFDQTEIDIVVSSAAGLVRHIQQAYPAVPKFYRKADERISLVLACGRSRRFPDLFQVAYHQRFAFADDRPGDSFADMNRTYLAQLVGHPDRSLDGQLIRTFIEGP